MLRTYGRQLTNAKRLARFRRALNLDGTQEEQSVSRQVRRRGLVERIAREIIENLIVNSQQTPIVADILDQLEQELGARHIFEYPLDGSDVQILRETERGSHEIVGQERDRVMRRLWEITLSRVDETML